MELLTRNSLRIVHVEDDPEFAQLSEILLKRAGFAQPIVRCKDGIRALHYFSMIEPETAPDVILLDLHMPHMDGLEVLHWLRHCHSEQDVAVYMLTSSSNPEDRRRAAADGVTEYLLKSPLFDELIQNLDHLIATTNSQRMEAARKMGGVMEELALMGKFAAEMIALTDVRGQIVWVNEHFVQTCDSSVEEMLGKQPGSILQVPEPDRAKIEMLHDAVRSGRECDCQIVHHKRNGAPCPVHISLGPVFHNNRLEGFLAVGKDLTDGQEQFASSNGHC